MNKKLKKGLTTTMAAAMGLGVVIPAVPVIAAPATSGWVNTAQGWTYYKSGVKATGWILDGGKWYLLDSNGVMKTGWAKDAGTWYFLNASGAMATGWFKDTDGSWYFFNNSGAMLANKWVGNYYVGGSGAMVVSTVTPDGWTVDANGAWDGHSKAADLKAATDAVVKAEASKAQADIDAATALIAKLTVAGDVTTLTARLNAIVSKLEVSSVSVINAKQLVVTFSKAVDATTVVEASGANKGTLVDGILKIDGTLADADVASLSADGKTLTINASASLVGNHTFELLANKVTDANGIYVPTIFTTFNGADTTRPTVTSVKYLTNTVVRVNFSEPLATVSGSLAYDDGSTVSGVAEAFTAGNNYVDYTITPASVTALKNIVVSYANATDYAGNIALPTTATFKYDNTDTTKPTITGVTPTSPTTFDVKFSKGLQAADATKILVAGTAASTATIDANDATLVHVVAAGTQTTPVVVTYSAGAVTDLNGNASASTTQLVDFTNVSAAAKVVSTSVQRVNGVESLIVNYDKNVTPQAKTLSFKYVDANGVNQTVSYTGTPGLYKAVNGVSNSIILNLSTCGLANNTSYTVNLVSGLVKDTWGTDSAAVTGVSVNTTNITFATGKLNVSSVSEVNPGVLEVVFDQKLDPASAKNVANYTVEGATIKEADLVANDSVNGYKVQLVLNDNTVETSGTYNVTVNGVLPYSPSATIEDATTLPVLITENVRATVKSVAVATLGTTSTVNVTFTKSVADGLTAGGDYTLYVGGVETAATVTETSSGAVVTFSMNRDLTTDISAGKTITLTATDANDIQDVDNNIVNADTITIK